MCLAWRARPVRQLTVHEIGQVSEAMWSPNPLRHLLAVAPASRAAPVSPRPRRCTGRHPGRLSRHGFGSDQGDAGENGQEDEADEEDHGLHPQWKWGAACSRRCTQLFKVSPSTPVRYGRRSCSARRLARCLLNSSTVVVIRRLPGGTSESAIDRTTSTPGPGGREARRSRDFSQRSMLARLSRG